MIHIFVEWWWINAILITEYCLCCVYLYTQNQDKKLHITRVIDDLLYHIVCGQAIFGLSCMCYISAMVLYKPVVFWHIDTTFNTVQNASRSVIFESFLTPLQLICGSWVFQTLDPDLQWAGSAMSWSRGSGSSRIQLRIIAARSAKWAGAALCLIWGTRFEGIEGPEAEITRGHLWLIGGVLPRP